MEGDLHARFALVKDKMTPAERRVARFLASMPHDQLIFATGDDLGRLTKTSDATVVRAARRLGYTGLPHLKREAGQHLATTVAPQESLSRRLAALGPDLSASATRIFADAAEGLEMTLASLDIEALQRAIKVLTHARSSFVYGYGSSELPAQHLARSLNRRGNLAYASGLTGLDLADDLIRIRRDDAVVIFQPARLLEDIDVLVEHAAAVGCRTIFIGGEALAERYERQVEVTLLALDTSASLSVESLSMVVLGDVLAYGLSQVDPDLALRTREQLTDLRDRLLTR